MNMQVGSKIVVKGKHPELCTILEISESSILVEFGTDNMTVNYTGDIYNVFSKKFVTFVKPMILFCFSGHSEFCINHKRGFYYVSEEGSKFLGLDFPGRNQTEYMKFYALKAFW